MSESLPFPPQVPSSQENSTPSSSVDILNELDIYETISPEKIFLGSAEMIEDKLARLKLFYKENMGRQGWNVYQLVNLKFKGQVIGKKIQQES